MNLSFNKKLLLLEDDLMFRKTLVTEFEERGYQVFAAENISTVRSALENNLVFDFALLDMRVGHELGLQIIPSLIEKNSKARVVILSGYPTVATIVGAIKAGAVNYLLKPSSIEIIEQALWIDGVDNDFKFDESDALPTTLDHYEMAFIEFVLLQCDWNSKKAAKRLGIHRQCLQRKMRKHPSISTKQVNIDNEKGKFL
jgi:two-component system, response regulator RegA